MHLDRPDPKYLQSDRMQRNFRFSLQAALWLTAVLWLILIVDNMLGLGLTRFGLRPREWSGLIGVFTAPLLHGGVEHLFSNTAPLIVSFTAILYLYPRSAMRVIPIIWLGAGALAWFIGRDSLHIGASGFIYGLLAYVFVSGILRMDMRSVAVSLIVWFLYGSMVWGVLPIRPNMSWESHLSGAIIGVVLAIIFRKWDQTPIKRYDWEDDERVPAWFPTEEEPTLDLGDPDDPQDPGRPYDPRDPDRLHGPDRLHDPRDPDDSDRPRLH